MDRFVGEAISSFELWRRSNGSLRTCKQAAHALRRSAPRSARRNDHRSRRVSMTLDSSLGVRSSNRSRRRGLCVGAGRFSAPLAALSPKRGTARAQTKIGRRDQPARHARSASRTKQASTQTCGWPFRFTIGRCGTRSRSPFFSRALAVRALRRPRSRRRPRPSRPLRHLRPRRLGRRDRSQRHRLPRRPRPLRHRRPFRSVRRRPRPLLHRPRTASSHRSSRRSWPSRPRRCSARRSPSWMGGSASSI